MAYPTASSYYDDQVHVALTPYGDNRWDQVAVGYGIKVPFERIVTRCMGTSTCPYCGARYVGYQRACENRVWWYRSGWQWTRGNKLFGTTESEHWNTDKVKETKMDLCRNGTDWDLAGEFAEQSRFFSFLSWLGNLPPEDYLEQYRHILTSPALLEILRIRDLQQQVLMLRSELDQHRSAIKEIAERMKQAGAVMSFGGFF